MNHHSNDEGRSAFKGPTLPALPVRLLLIYCVNFHNMHISLFKTLLLVAVSSNAVLYVFIMFLHWIKRVSKK